MCGIVKDIDARIRRMKAESVLQAGAYRRGVYLSRTGNEIVSSFLKRSSVAGGNARGQRVATQL